MNEEIELPRFGLTELPPWGQCIALFDKDVENRGFGVMRQIRRYRGPVLLSQSAWKREHDVDSEAMWYSLIDDGLVPKSPVPNEVRSWAGKAFAVANLVDLIGPSTSKKRRWHVPGQYGLVLQDVQLIEPVACSGGQGFWRTTWCNVCGRIAADTWVAAKSNPCTGCQKQKERIDRATSGPRPKLRIVGRKGNANECHSAHASGLICTRKAFVCDGVHAAEHEGERIWWEKAEGAVYNARDIMIYAPPGTCINVQEWVPGQFAHAFKRREVVNA